MQRSTPAVTRDDVRPSRRILPLIVVGAVLIRLLPWSTVFVDGYVNLRGNDAWYHLRVVDHVLVNFPHRLTIDPYAVAGGQYVPLALLFDLLVAGLAWILGLGHPSDQLVETVASWLPPLCGGVVTGLVYLLGARLFDRRVGLLGAALVAIMPGHLLERTLLGFADHHALEAVLAFATLVLLMRALSEAGGTQLRWATLAGASLGAYLLTWSSGAFLVLVLAAWVIAQLVLESWRRRDAPALSRVIVPAAVLALALVLAFQPPELPRYNAQVATLIGLGLAACGLDLLRRLVDRTAWPRVSMLLGLAGLAVFGGLVAWWLDPQTMSTLLLEAGRIRGGTAQLSVTEARPLLYPSGSFDLGPTWDSFRTVFFIGVPALAAFTLQAVRSGSRPRLLMAVWCVVTLGATLGQNRFGYYLGPTLAVLTGWVVSAVLGWAGVWRTSERSSESRGGLETVAVVLVAGVVFAPSLRASIETGVLLQGQTPAWHGALEWLRENTPEPFPGGDQYNARYDDADLAAPDYAVMSWWDYGYWITRTARRVPVANPTQRGARSAGRFFASTSESEASLEVERVGARYVIANAFLPLGLDSRTALLSGAFESIVSWAEEERNQYYESFFQRQADGVLSPVWLFYPNYYRAMAVRLALFGGTSVSVRETWVISFEQRVDGLGVPYREVTSARRFGSYPEAETYRAALGPGNHRIAGLDPTEPCVPIDALRQYVPVYGGAAAGSGSTVRIFEYRAGPSGPATGG
jgi:dolichyl-diphosphooligosaccharide--protein glycosyltransferase